MFYDCFSSGMTFERRGASLESVVRSLISKRGTASFVWKAACAPVSPLSTTCTCSASASKPLS